MYIVTLLKTYCILSETPASLYNNHWYIKKNLKVLMYFLLYIYQLLTIKKNINK